MPGTNPIHIQQGDLYWVPLLASQGADTSIIHPHVVIQADVLNHNGIPTVVVCALTTNRKRAKDPGNVFLDAGEGNLPKQSIVVVSQVATIEKTQLGAYIGTLSEKQVQHILAGIKFIPVSPIPPNIRWP